MSNINFFQHYSQKENVVTNNSLSLLAQIYDHDPSLLNELIGKMVDGVSIETGINMEQQERESDSIPDGSLSQESFKILIETKPSDDYDLDQLKRHCKAFEDEHHKILLLLMKNIDEGGERRVKKAVEKINPQINFSPVTYADLIHYLIGEDGLIKEYDRDLKKLVEDYRNFCSEEDLLPIDDLMRSVPCGKSHDIAEKYDVYYAPAHRGYQRHQYIGVYYDKCVQSIGKIDCTVEADREGEDLNVKSKKGCSSLTDDQKDRILGAMDAVKEKGNDIDSGTEFFLVDKFHETDFKKVSKGGIMFKYFNLRDYLDIGENENLPDTKEIAEILSYETWE